MTKRKMITVLIVAVVFMLLAAPFIKRNKVQKPEYMTSVIKKATIRNEITATGTLKPLQTVDIGTQVSGIVSKLYVDFNDHVRRGQVIAKIDTTNLYISIIDAEANLMRAESQFVQQKQEFQRYKELLEKKAASQSDYDQIFANYKSAESSIKSAEAGLQRARTNMRYATISAPIDGIITFRAVEEGQTVAASFNTPTLFTIANDLTKMQLQARVDEADIGMVKMSQLVIFTVDAYPEDEFRGTVQQIRLQPNTSQNVVTYTVIIDAPNPDLKLLPGMNATLSIIVKERKDVIIAPLAAFGFQNMIDSMDVSGRTKIYTLVGKDSLSPIIVEKGLDDGNLAEITKGNVKEGLIVVTGTRDPLTKKMKSFFPEPPKNRKRNEIMAPPH